METHITFSGDKSVIDKLKLQAVFDYEIKEVNPLQDRFFLEEIIKRAESEWDNFNEYSQVLLFDWMKEKIKMFPITELERRAYLHDTGWDEDFIESAYFGSEKELYVYLYGEEEIEELKYSITDASTTP